MQPDLSEIRAEYAQLRARLSKVGWISQGYAQDVTGHFKTSQAGSNQNQPLRGEGFISVLCFQSRGFVSELKRAGAEPFEP